VRVHTFFGNIALRSTPQNLALWNRGRPLPTGLHNGFQELMLSRIQHVSGFALNVARKIFVIFAGTKHSQQLRVFAFILGYLDPKVQGLT
jgi:hypothetical protein